MIWFDLIWFDLIWFDLIWFVYQERRGKRGRYDSLIEDDSDEDCKYFKILKYLYNIKGIDDVILCDSIYKFTSVPCKLSSSSHQGWIRDLFFFGKVIILKFNLFINDLLIYGTETMNEIVRFQHVLTFFSFLWRINRVKTKRELLLIGAWPGGFLEIMPIVP